MGIYQHHKLQFVMLVNALCTALSRHGAYGVAAPQHVATAHKNALGSFCRKQPTVVTAARAWIKTASVPPKSVPLTVKLVHGRRGQLVLNLVVVVHRSDHVL